MKSVYSVILALTCFHKRSEIIKNIFGLHHSTYPWTIQRPPPSKPCVSNQLLLSHFYITHILSLSKHCIFQISKSANIASGIICNLVFFFIPYYIFETRSCWYMSPVRIYILSPILLLILIYEFLAFHCYKLLYNKPFTFIFGYAGS